MIKIINGHVRCLEQDELEGKTIQMVWNSLDDDEVYMLTTDGDMVRIGTEGDTDEDDLAPTFYRFADTRELARQYVAMTKYHVSYERDKWDKAVELGLIPLETINNLNASREQEEARQAADRRAQYELLKKEFESC